MLINMEKSKKKGVVRKKGVEPIFQIGTELAKNRFDPFLAFLNWQKNRFDPFLNTGTVLNLVFFTCE